LNIWLLLAAAAELQIKVAGGALVVTELLHHLQLLLEQLTQ
jgi:hypothetical protein